MLANLPCVIVLRILWVWIYEVKVLHPGSFCNNTHILLRFSVKNLTFITHFQKFALVSIITPRLLKCRQFYIIYSHKNSNVCFFFINYRSCITRESNISYLGVSLFHLSYRNTKIDKHNTKFLELRKRLSLSSEPLNHYLLL